MLKMPSWTLESSKIIVLIPSIQEESIKLRFLKKFWELLLMILIGSLKKYIAQQTKMKQLNQMLIPMVTDIMSILSVKEKPKYLHL